MGKIHHIEHTGADQRYVISYDSIYNESKSGCIKSYSNLMDCLDLLEVELEDIANKEK